VSLFGGRNEKRQAPGARTGAHAPSGGPGQRTDAGAPNEPTAGSASRSNRGRAPQEGADVANVGQSVVFKGELSGDEDLAVEGRIEGRIDLPEHRLTIGEHGRAQAEIQAKTVIVLGHVVGNVLATERCEVHASGVVEGDIHAPRLVIEEGAVVNGAVRMGDPPSTATESDRNLRTA